MLAPEFATQGAWLHAGLDCLPREDVYLHASEDGRFYQQGRSRAVLIALTLGNTPLARKWGTDRGLFTVCMAKETGQARKRTCQ